MGEANGQDVFRYTSRIPGAHLPPPHRPAVVEFLLRLLYCPDLEAAGAVAAQRQLQLVATAGATQVRAQRVKWRRIENTV